MVKNILFTYITPFHPERGGIGRVTHLLTLELQKRGYNVFYLIYDSAITVKHEYDYPAPLAYFPSKELTSKENISFYHQFLKEHAIDVVINQSGNFSDSELYLNKGDNNVKLISVLHQPPLVAYNHLWSEVFPLKNKSLIEKFKRIARILLYPKIKYQFKKSRINHFKKLLPQTDLVCMLSANYFSELSQICSGYENKYIAIPNPNSFQDEAIGISGEKKRKELLYVGLLVQNKRVDRILAIWNAISKRYPEWSLRIVGAGEENYVQNLKSIVSQAQNVFFEGFQNPQKYYRQSRIFCMTSNYEGWGMVLTEAMQYACVPIAFNSSGAFPDIIDNDRNGILISPFDMKDYERKLCELIDNEELLHTLSKNAQEDIKRYSVEKVVDLWELVL
jgi:glycosyltransferase involved in cell wall biosynthesis